MAFVRLDGALPLSLNMLLKLLESPPSVFRIILSSTYLPISTVMSRAQLYRLGTLSEGEIAEILVSVYDVVPAEAERFASMSDGTVAKAREIHKIVSSKLSVISAVRAVEQQDNVLLTRVTKDWTADHSEALTTWAIECIARKWRLFSPEEISSNKTMARSILVALTSVMGTTPRIGVRAAMSKVIQEGAWKRSK